MTRILSFLLAALLLASPAFADDGKPEATKPIHIAMLFQKLTSTEEPPYEDWLKRWPKYQKANLMDRTQMVEQYTAEMKDAYNLITTSDPIVVNAKVKLSGYSPLQKGFLVQNFNDMTFFSFPYMGQKYAVIPSGMANFQWLKAPASMIDSIARETNNGQDAELTLTLMSLKADPNPMIIGKNHYNLMLAEISKIEMWAKDGKSTVWDSNIAGGDKQLNSLMGLHQ